MLKAVSSITNAIGALNYKGTWNASTNTPTLASGVGTKGDYYVVSVAGATTLDGISNWGVGDWAAYNGSVWQRVEGGADGNFVNLSVSSTSTLSGLTASTALALDASKNVVSVTNTGTGSNVLANSPALATPNLGTPTALVLTSATGLPLTTGVTGTLPVANGGTGVTTSTGTGNTVLSASPTLSGILTVGAATGQNGVFDAVVGNADATTGDSTGLVIVSNSTGQGWLGFNNGNSAGIPGQVTYNHNTAVMNFYSSGTISTNGIYGNTTANAANMHVDSSGILYRSTSTEKYKTDIEPILQNYSDNVLNLKPIWYRSKTDNLSWSWYGLSAEDVALKDPRLAHWGYPEDCYEITNDENGGLKKVLKPNSQLVPDGVQYERIAVLLLDVVKRLKEDFEQYKLKHP